MKSDLLMKPAIVLFFVTTNPVLAQPGPGMPCPPPGLETIVGDTQLNCDCFYSLAASGLDLGDKKTFEKVFNDNTVQTIAQTGDFVGIDGISEYLSFVEDENGFVTDYRLIGQSLVLDFTGSTREQCVATIAERRQLAYNPEFVLDNQDVCADTVVGSVLYYTLTGNPAAPITIQKVNVYLPDDFFSETFSFFTSSPAAFNFVCDTLVTTCGDDTSASSGRRLTRALKRTKRSKKGKSSKSKLERCVRKLKKLPNISPGDLSYIDGDSRGCRILHSVFARTNPSIHCAHITFEGEEDPNGNIKCTKSKQRKLTDLFTLQQLGLFTVAASLLGLPESGFSFSLETCPARPVEL